MTFPGEAGELFRKRLLLLFEPEPGLDGLPDKAG